MTKNRIYAMVTLSLLFGACNSPDNRVPSPDITQSAVVVKPEPIKEAPTSTSVQKSSNSIKYIDKPIVIEQGMLHIKGFMGTLQPTLKDALKQDKTQETAMGACSSMAMQMTDDYNKITTDVKVRRTALKYRNPKNRPDNTDKEVMYRLQAVGDFKPVAVDMGDRYRVYKPIKTKRACLLCHGDTSKISPKVLKILHAKYPHDLATGFTLGEFRGAVVAEIQK